MSREVFWLKTGAQRKAEGSIGLPAPQRCPMQGLAQAGTLGEPSGAVWGSGAPRRAAPCLAAERGNKRSEAAIASQLNFGSWKCTGTNN